MRKAVAGALGHFSKEPVVYKALLSSLRNDVSYAVEGVAIQALGRSGAPQAFDVLQAEALAKPEVHVMIATLYGLAATKDPSAAEILLAQARGSRASSVERTCRT